MVQRPIKRLLLCTSPLQVVTARSAMEVNQKPGCTYQDWVWMIHPEIPQASQQLIQQFAKKLNFEGVLNLSQEYGKILSLFRTEGLQRYVPFLGWRDVAARDIEIDLVLKQIEAKRKEVGETTWDEVYVRHHLATIELLV